MDEFFDKMNENKTEGENRTEEVTSEDSASVTEPDVMEEPDNTAPDTQEDYVGGEQQTSSIEPVDDVSEYQNEDQSYADPPIEDAYSQQYNPINYSEIKPVTDYKPMSKGLKAFAGIMAAVILLTGACTAGYFMGKNSVGTVKNSNVSVDLSAKPKDTDEMTAAQVYDKTNKSIVGITAYNTAGNGAQASGVIYSKDGYIVTNDHIYSEVPSAKFKIYTSDDKEYDAKFVAGDKISDLAVLKIESGSGFSVADFGDSNQLINGENVVAIGRPSDASTASSITKGIISATSRRVATTTSYSARLIQTDSAINPGSSGGALINMYGQVIGITSSKLAGVSYDAVGYAIPTTTMKRIVTELISKGKVVSRAKLGISYNAINSVTAEINKYEHVGLYVASVSEDSDLNGKITEGDIITHINGEEITDDSKVLDIIENSVAGDKITITVVKKSGGTKNLDAVLKANTSESSYSTKASSGNSSQSGSGNNPGDSSDGNTFDFPFGE